MRYIVKAGTDGSAGVRIAVRHGHEAIRVARDLAHHGAATVEVSDQSGATFTLVEFGRSLVGHSLTPEEIDLVAGTCDIFLSAGDTVANLFYARLFELAPETRTIFKADMSGQKRKLIDMLMSLVGQITHPDMFVPLVRNLARTHAALGARPEHYPPVGQALLASLESLLGDRFTPEVRSAWTTLYGDLSAAMIAAAPRTE